MSLVAEQIRRQARELLALADQIEKAEREGAGIVPTVIRDQRIAAVVAAVCRQCGRHVADVMADDRSQEIAETRFLVAWALHTLLGLRDAQIAHVLGRHRKAIAHALRRVSELRGVDLHFAERLSLAMAAAKSALAEAENLAA